jgi:hypothetical protein
MGNKVAIFAPTGSKVTIGKTAYGYLSEDLQINLSSSFDKLINWTPPGWLVAGVEVVNSWSGAKIPAGVQQFGYEIWTSTEPVSFSFELAFYQGMTVEGNIWTQATIATNIKALLKLPLPVLDGSKIGLFPPGPSIVALMKDSSTDNHASGSLSIKFGNGISFARSVITSVKPTVSRYAAGGMPIYVKLAFDAQGIVTASDATIEEWFKDAK